MQQDLQKAVQKGYNKANFQSGYGIGDLSNVTGGFNAFNDSNALRNEIGRMNTVMGNRTQYGLANDGFQSYYDKLNSAYQPFTQAENKATQAQTAFNTQQTAAQQSYLDAFKQFDNKITQANDSYKQGPGYTGYIDSMNQTVDSIASKYGFSFNRDAARQQAESEAQALRDANAHAARQNESANKLNTGKIDANLMNMAEGLDRNYFQKMMQQQQNQVNGGLNAGIASDQDLRLQMARQAEMGGAYRDANLGKMSEQERFTNDQLRLTEALGTINQQALAREQGLMSDFEKQMYDVISNDRNFYQGAANMEWGQSQDLVNQYLGQQDRLTSNFQADRAFDYGALRDIIGDTQFDRNLAQQQFGQQASNDQWAQEFQRMLSRDNVQDGQWNQQFDWNALMDAAGLTGNFNGGRTLAGRASDLNQSQFDWSKQMDQAGLQLERDTLAQRKAEFASDAQWREYEFNNMSATERARLAQNSQQFGEDMAWKLFELEASQALTREMSQAELAAYTGSSRNSTTGSLGSLSQKYESSGNPGVVARTKGDIGGASYGSYQLTTASGHAQKFANQYGGSLKGLKAGTAAFDAAWKQEAQKNPTAFGAAQHNYIEKTHYQPAANKFKSVTGIDPSKQPQAVQDMIWSIGVQHGAGGAASIFKNAGISSPMNAETIIKRVYGERMKVDKYFSSSPSNIKKSVKNRFQNEMQDALKMLRK